MCDSPWRTDAASQGLRGHAVCTNVINLKEDVYMSLGST